MDLYRQHADTAGFPSVRPLLQSLGVIRESNEVRLSNAAELAYLRQAMTGRDAWRQQDGWFQSRSRYQQSQSWSVQTLCGQCCCGGTARDTPGVLDSGWQGNAQYLNHDANTR
jgi:hypothetical protein